MHLGSSTQNNDMTAPSLCELAASLNSSFQAGLSAPELDEAAGEPRRLLSLVERALEAIEGSGSTGGWAAAAGGALGHPQRRDVAASKASDIGTKAAATLSMLHYPPLFSAAEAESVGRGTGDRGGTVDASAQASLAASLAAGTRTTCLDVLAYLAANMPRLRQRAYLSRWLAPVEAEVPAGLLAVAASGAGLPMPPMSARGRDASSSGMSALAQAVAELRVLQAEFRDVYALACGADGGSVSSGGEVGHEAVSPSLHDESQAQDERRQLLAAIASAERRAGNAGPAFPSMLAAVTALRRAQEAMAAADGHAASQAASAAAASVRLAAANAAHRASPPPHADAPAVDILEAARGEAGEAALLARRVLPAALATAVAESTRLRTAAMSLTAPHEAGKLSCLRASAEQAGAALEAAKAAAVQRVGDASVSAMRRTATAAAALAVAERDGATVAVQLARKEAAARATKVGAASQAAVDHKRRLSRGELAAYGHALRGDTARYRVAMTELSSMRATAAERTAAAAALRVTADAAVARHKEAAACAAREATTQRERSDMAPALAAIEAVRFLRSAGVFHCTPHCQHPIQH